MQRALFLLLLFLLSTVMVGQATALNGKIVFETYHHRNDEIYVMDADGDNLRNLTQHPARDFRPDWSPDGKQIAFISNRDGNDEIYVIDANGDNVSNLTNHDAGDWQPDWSPDGKQILFLSDRDGGINTYVMDANGQNVRRLTDYPPEGEFADAPVWSPDGEEIVFEWVKAGGSGIYVMNSNGIDIHPVSPPEKGVRKGHAQWSPDAKQIVYFVWKNYKAKFSNMMLATRVRGNLWESERVLLPQELALNTVCWSPDGEHLLFGAGDKELPRIPFNIYRYTFRNREVVQLTDLEGWDTIAPDWSAHALSVSLQGSITTYWGQIKAERK